MHKAVCVLSSNKHETPRPLTLSQPQIQSPMLPGPASACKARSSKAPLVPLDSVPGSALAHLVGNGMNVVCAGAVLLVACVHVEKKGKL